MPYNPLLEPSSLPHQAVNFKAIKDEHYLPALDIRISEAQEKIGLIKHSTGQPSFQNTIVALEEATADLDLLELSFENLIYAHSSPKKMEIAKIFSPKLSQFRNSLFLDEDLFKKVNEVYQNKPDLSTEDDMLLKTTFKAFENQGALLQGPSKEEFKKVSDKLSQLYISYGENSLKATNSFEMHLADQKDLDGLPSSSVTAAGELAASKNKDGYIINLQAPSYIPFMTYAKDRSLRQKLFLAKAQNAMAGEHSNQSNVLEIIKLREKKAQLLGHKNFAEYTLKDRMAKSTDTVFGFIDKLISSSKPAAQKELSELQEFTDSLNGPNPLQAWDFSFYSNLLKKQKFDFDEQQLRPYFQLENVIDGAFKHAEKLYGIKFTQKTQDYSAYQEDVEIYEVHNLTDNSFVGLFYTDFFPRESKRSGAWMTSYRLQGLSGGQIKRPHISIVCNFTKPTADAPSLLDMNEVRTLFHEFGHALHGLLSDCTYRSLSGTNVYRDFVELPSQVLENWALEKEGLDLFAKHYQTGEPLPADLLEKIKKNAQFQAGYASLRQCSFAHLDMKWHTTDSKNIENVIEFENQTNAGFELFPKDYDKNMSCSFGHIFSGEGYSAGYYSYKWAEVLDADAFEYFKESGIFNTEVAKSFKDNILSRGGSEHPMELYKKFRGRTPDPDALLRRDGLI